MQLQLPARVLRSQPYGESHAILQLLSESGTLSAIARGAKKPHSKLRATTHLGSKSIYQMRLGSGMATILQAELLESPKGPQVSVEKAAYAAYFSDLVRLSVPEYPNGNKEPFQVLDRIYDLMENLDESDISMLAMLLEARVLRWSGVAPDVEYCGICGNYLNEDKVDATHGYAERLGQFLCQRCWNSRNPLSGERAIPLSEKELKILRALMWVPIQRLGHLYLSAPIVQNLRRILRYHLSEFAGIRPRSAKILEEILLPLAEGDLDRLTSSFNSSPLRKEDKPSGD
ncbi:MULTISPECIES: DNA repair protein RecO [Alicyclobacillus]|uniref:DNA repair protein RecO n=2 Tax=Alicyclobacillus tolerans TaxID=90970 RepID=A0A1M6JW40_9BACL|nr:MULTISPECIES: DNA repair protein RecO [Alicyclobacillus]MDP9727387.1 DNA repair protein RecO (recombination protein O) [Alicyclobacillus tengchongensis]SHJ50868.1 DNA replication and repair protein RecO [Alicyclobacillus montanus]